MSKWKDSDEWSEWTCATCDVNQSDPDAVSITSCQNGHTNYLGPVHGQHRRAYKSARERAKDINEHNALVEMMSGAIFQGRKRIKLTGKNPKL